MSSPSSQDSLTLLHPLRLQLENFRSYESLDFTFPNGLTLVDGSNGAGKSTIFDAFFWARYGWLPKWEGPKGGRADAVIRRGTEKARVTVHERIGQDEIIIERQRPHKLTVWKNGEKLKSCSQEDLENMLGMSAERCLICVYFAQKRKRTFFSMSDSEKTELLSTMAGLEELDRALEKAKDLKTHRQSQVNLTQGKIELANEWLKEFPTKIKEAEEALAILTANQLEAQARHLELEKINKERVETFQLQHKADLKQKEEEKDQILSVVAPKATEARRVYQEIEAKIKDVPKVEQSYFLKVSEAKTALQNFNAQLKEKNRIADKNAKLLDKIQNELDQMDKAKDGKCSSCSQPLPLWEMESHKNKHLDRAQEYEAQLETEIELDESILPTLEKDLEEAEHLLAARKAELNVLPSQLESEKKTALALYNQANAEVNAINSNYKTDLMGIEQEFKTKVQSLLQEIHLSKVACEKNDAAVLSAQKELDLRSQEHKARIDEVEKLSKDLKEAEASLSEALDLIEIFGPKGYRSVCFDGLIQRISDRAGQLISVLSDGVYSTYLEQIGSDSKGNQKLVLKPMILRSGQEVYDDDLSGGFEDRIALAYDLAVSEAAGDGLPLLLDEVLKGLDASGKIEAMSLLEEVAKIRPVLVIDHTTEMKALFHQSIRIVNENDLSRIV